MDSAHFLRLFRDHTALQTVQEELAASRGNSLVMVVDDRGTAKIFSKVFWSRIPNHSSKVRQA